MIIVTTEIHIPESAVSIVKAYLALLTGENPNMRQMFEDNLKSICAGYGKGSSAYVVNVEIREDSPS